MQDTSAVAGQFGFTWPETFSGERIAGLFSDMFRHKAEGRAADEASAQTSIGGDERREELLELAVQWGLQEMHMLIESLSAAHDIDFIEAIRTRMTSLREMLQEEEGATADLDPDSLRAFVAFLHQAPGVRRPGITLTPEGEVYARWQGQGSRLFAVHFISGEKVRFVISRPNPRHPRLVQRVSGVDAVDTILGTANDACSVLEWISQ